MTVLTIAALGIGSTAWRTDAFSPAQAAAKSADGVKLQILDWEATQKLIASKKGKIVVVDAWSTSCIPCMKEFPNLVDLHQKYGKDVACVSLNLDYIGLQAKPPEYYRERVLKFLTDKKADFDNVLSSVESDKMYENLEIPSIPAVFVYDRQGKLVKTFDSSEGSTEEEAFTYADVTALVEKLLKTK
jgi:thiol-disulfide isomerase/thioredoxin